MEYRDYYATLGVPRTASQAEIKKAFRKLARQHHPDANKGNATAEGRFKEINEANEVLSDPEKRKLYDQLGTNWGAYQQAGGSGSGGGNPFAGFGGFGGRSSSLSSVASAFIAPRGLIRTPPLVVCSSIAVLPPPLSRPSSRRLV